MNKLTLMLPLVAMTFDTHAQITDDFNAGNDAAWTRHQPIQSFGAGGTYSFPNGGYRIEAAGSPLPGAIGPARAASIATGVSLSDFSVSYDLVDWGATPQFAGALTRIGNLGLGTTSGYAAGFDFTVNRLFISRITGEQVSQVVSFSPVVPLDIAKDYRLTFTGIGNSFTGELSEIGGPVLTVIAGSDGAYSTGGIGLLVAAQTPTAGVGADATFDNFSAGAAIPEPQTWALLGVGLASLLMGCKRR